MLWVLGIIVLLIAAKAIWVAVAIRNIGSFATEKADLFCRRDYLISKIVTEPKTLIDRMPFAVGPQFQGEWALYSCSMLSASLVNMVQLYPETWEEAATQIDSLIKIVMSPELRAYDRERWGEDPLMTLDGDKSHVSYLSHLAWMIAGYKQIGGDEQYDDLYHSLCETMNRRLQASPGFNLQTYPGEYVYIPDMLVAIVALKLYSKQHAGEYDSTVQKWLDNMKKNHLSESSGNIASMVMYDYDGPSCVTVKGSYTALSCYYLTFIDEDFARDQYEKLKARFLKKWPLTGFKEYEHKSPILGMDIDAGPIVFGLSPSGTAFGVGPATYFQDWEVRNSILKTAEIAGSTVTCGGKSHYLLANIALVGEAITLAMRTAVPWDSTHDYYNTLNINMFKKQTIKEIESLTPRLSRIHEAYLDIDHQAISQDPLKVERALTIREKLNLKKERYKEKDGWKFCGEAFVLENTCPSCGNKLYVVHQTSPMWTWVHLCGREGYLLFCPHCKKDIDFYLTVMN